MATYNYIDNTKICEFQKFEKTKVSNVSIAYMEYTIKEDFLRIDWIENKRNFGHHGTDLVIEFVKLKKIDFKEIYGIISTSQIQFWGQSIPFYLDLPKWIKKETGLSYEFHLYDNRKYEDEIKPFSKDMIDDFIKKHRELSCDASFKLKLVGNVHCV